METMTRLEELQSIYWDMYKDAYGYRLRGIDTSAWTEAEFTAEFEQMCQVIERENIARAATEEKASIAFEMPVQAVIACGASDRAMALRWIHEAEGSNGDDEYL